MTRIVANALGYFAAIFALGFVLGTIRTLWLAPRLGSLPAVLLELPLMLAASWLCARTILARAPLPDRRSALVMGAIAFTLLMAAELLLGVLLFGQSPHEWLAALAWPEGLAGLVGQVGFALIPAAIRVRKMES